MKPKLFLICMFMSAATLTGRAEGGQAGNLTWNLSEDGTLTVSGTGAMDDYERGSAPWYSSRSKVKTIVITDGVTTIGQYTFEFCPGLTSVTIPWTDPSVILVHSDIFRGVSKVTLYVPKGTASLYRAIVPWKGFKIAESATVN